MGEPRVLFHGGCTGCNRQNEMPIDECINCCYFDSDWHLPDLNNRPRTGAEQIRGGYKG